MKSLPGAEQAEFIRNMVDAGIPLATIAKSLKLSIHTIALSLSNQNRNNQ